MPVILPKNRIRDWLLDANQIDDILFGNQPELVKSEADGNQLELIGSVD